MLQKGGSVPQNGAAHRLWSPASAMPPLRSTPAARSAVLAAVLLAHALLWWGAQALGVWRERRPPPPAAPPLQVRVVVLPVPPPDDVALPVPAPHPPSPVPMSPPSVALQVPPSAPPALQWIAPPAPPATAAVPAPPAAPLVLDLPRGASAPARSPALDDPRANTRRPTLESRIAGATGGDTDTGGAWTEEPMAGGLMRVRRGRECWIVAPNRDSQLDPFNQSAVARLRAARPC